jgi:ligand-binding sensor domain-containing protein/signal transduction histidine kinase
MFRPAIGLFIAILLLLQLRAGASQYLVDSWDSDQGLPDNFVTSIVRTPDGYLWVGTYHGLARFDGSAFVTYKPENTPQLGHERIVKLFLDAEGTLWINTYDGSLTSLRNGAFSREWDGAGKGISEAWMVASDSKEIIFAFRSGLLIRRAAAGGGPKDWEVLTPPGPSPGAYYCRDGAGTLWCSTLDGKLWRIRGGKYELVPKEAGLRGEEFHWLEADPSGRIWTGTEKELAAWDGARWQDMAPEGEADLDIASLSFTKDGGVVVAANGRLRKLLNGKWVAEFNPWPNVMEEDPTHSSFYQDREGGLWRMSRGNGIYHMSPQGEIQRIAMADGLPGGHTTCCFEDQEGALWVGTGRAGFARLRKNPIEILSAPGQPVGPAMSVCEDGSGALWVGTYGSGLDRWQNGIATEYPILSADMEDIVFSIYPGTHGGLWLSAGREDLSGFQAGEAKPAPVAVHAVKCILQDNEGRVWLGRKDGVDCWADGTLREWSSHEGSISVPVRALVEDRQGKIWMGADDGNLYQFDGSEPRAHPLPAYPARQAIFSMLADGDGSLWIGTADAGLLHFDGSRFTRFTAREGLPDDLICQILDDQRGNLWLGTHHGICRVAKAALEAFVRGRTPAISCSVYGRSDGLPTLQCTDMYQPSAWRGHDGKLWFATAKGVVGLQPEEMPLNSRAPTVVIQQFLTDGNIHALPQAGGRQIPEARVLPGEQNLEFDFVALSLTNPESDQYRYKLEGFDRDWINPEGRRMAQYSYLKPGNYRFRVVASNNDGVWNETGASLDVRVLPHFWETWWFLTLAGLVSLGTAAGIARYVSVRGMRGELERLARQRDIEQDRTRIARDIHDHIGSGLTHINLLNELLLGDPVEHLPDRIGQITGVTCELMSAMDEIVWALNPKNDTLESLVNYLCEYAGEYLRVAKVRLFIDVPGSLPGWHVTSEVRHNLFLAVKEILNNIAKHSQATEVFLTLVLDATSARLEIRDNGRGFPLDPVLAGLPGGVPHSNGNGLDNLKRRASAIGGPCRIRGGPGKGASIELTIPVPTPEGARTGFFNRFQQSAG